jgi:hypothetical protein
MILTESTFLLFAAKHYENPHCHDESEFEEDLKRFQYLRKLFNKYKQTGELKERLILNHLIILYNVFGPAATDMLFMRLEGYHDCLKPFVAYLNYLPIYIRYDGKHIFSDMIDSDNNVTEILKRI